MAQTSAPCKGCGADIPRTHPHGSIRSYCTPECWPRCLVDGCDKPFHSTGYCSTHLACWKRTGDPIPATGKNIGSCSVPGCGQPMRKRGWCASHYANWHRTGQVKPFQYKWAPQGLACRVCGQPAGSGNREYCSDACKVYASKGRLRGIVRPVSRPCPCCSRQVILIPTGGETRGRIKRSDTGVCARCKQDRPKHGLSVQFLADRDGTDCGICKQPVDMKLKAPELMRPSVDHIFPRARGGTNEPDNLQLAHLRCNQVKKDSVLEPKGGAAHARSWLDVDNRAAGHDPLEPRPVKAGNDFG